ncbi:hypothetical protein PUNSTDRAFT_50766 [Punctularia strigosozonata HHB-11173 SS5]|uniref:uncharacterized protein n=1 Tax=Punctularia strigosozonata (strain HHB-11173) TaxID=741275 RepID=UPI0004418210|nr:uncharacterized protein PUNSTDRAFT_50766 [Punctularia strigosozonata HHB-11173 SS5]EIN11969.1 hypothetical protein PUNSTDRAFT_50766 [Punctularia strigosozonata HHB-11173 SS5]
MASNGEETAPLLSNSRPFARSDEEHEAHERIARAAKVRVIVSGVLTAVFVAALIVMFVAADKLNLGTGDRGTLPKDPLKAAHVILKEAPIIDGHIDLPILARGLYSNNVTAIDLEKEMPAHVDIPRLKKGQVGGFFWSVYVGCPDGDSAGPDFLNATWRVRDTLEQIDVAKLLIEKYPDTFQLSLGTGDAKEAIIRGKIASFLGIEGGHQIGNSLAALRQFYELGVRYMTLTHSCHNAFADSCGILEPIEPLHGGLSEIGRTLIHEMNRLGMLVDLSHTSDATAAQAIKLSKAPVIWSHSSARAIANVPRNVPDEILKLIGTGKDQTDAVVMVNFAPFFVSKPPEKADLKLVADHIDHIGNVAGRKHVGIGSDYDGIGSTPAGLDDVSKYPELIAELYSRGWTRRELAGLAGGNLIRVFEGAEKVASELRASGAKPAMEVYHKRQDL